MSNASGTTKVIDTSSLANDALKTQVFQYVKELSGGRELTPTSRPGVWMTLLDDGTVLNVRSVSNSNAGRWTVDVQNSPSLKALKPNRENNSYEIKFK